MSKRRVNLPVYPFSKYTYMSFNVLKSKLLIYWYEKLAQAELRLGYWQSKHQERAVNIVKMEIAKYHGEIQELEHTDAELFIDRIYLANLCAALKL